MDYKRDFVRSAQARQGMAILREQNHAYPLRPVHSSRRARIRCSPFEGDAIRAMGFFLEPSHEGLVIVPGDGGDGRGGGGQYPSAARGAQFIPPAHACGFVDCRYPLLHYDLRSTPTFESAHCRYTVALSSESSSIRILAYATSLTVVCNATQSDALKDSVGRGCEAETVEPLPGTR